MDTSDLGRSTYSETFLGNEIFAAFRSLGVLCALTNTDAVQLPFDGQLARFLAESAGTIGQLFSSIGQFSGLSKVVTERCALQFRWLDPLKSLGTYDAKVLDAELVMASKASKWKQFDYKDLPRIQEVAKAGIRVQIVNLLNSLVDSRFSFSRGIHKIGHRSHRHAAANPRRSRMAVLG